MLHGFDERFPVHVLLWPVRVQGETCAAEVAAAIRGLQRAAAGGPMPRPDVLIVARGGGSLEDLWGFNEEIVVRAAAASAIPLISAVGHETDWTLIDLAADARAPTPTKAAEWAVPRYSELLEQTGKLARAARHRAPGARSTACARICARPAAACRAAATCWPCRASASMPSTGAWARALLANTRAHAMRLPAAPRRLQPRLLEIGLARTRDRLDALGRRTLSALVRSTGPRRARLERIAGRLSRSPSSPASRAAASGWRCSPARATRHARPASPATAAISTAAPSCCASLSYHGVLQRGYALVRDSEGRSAALGGHSRRRPAPRHRACRRPRCGQGARRAQARDAQAAPRPNQRRRPGPRRAVGRPGFAVLASAIAP